MRVLTAGGEVTLARPYFWAKGAGGVFPADAAAGIDAGRVSPGARQVLCRLGMVESFARAAEDATRIGNVPVGRERLRQRVEAEGAAAAAARDTGVLPAAGTAADAAVDPAVPGSPTRVYLGVDGVLAPTVTRADPFDCAQGDKRRAGQAVRRQQRSAAGVGNAKPLPPARPGTDQRYKEMKIGLFYDQAKRRRRHAFATAGDSGAFGPLLAVHAAAVGFEAADQSLSVTDGAKWIAAQVCLTLLAIKGMLLDFSPPVRARPRGGPVLPGRGDAGGGGLGGRPAGGVQDGRRHAGPGRDRRARPGRPGTGQARGVAGPAGVRRRPAGPARLPRRPGRRAGRRVGPDRGGACKTLTLRLKGSGMKWDRDHAAAMMNLTALYDSGQADAYWATAA